MNLYFLMTALFMGLALIGALDAALTSWNLLPWFNGLRWLRVHMITLGAMTEALFGVLPLLVAIRANLPRPGFRWATWFTLNTGILTLLVGIPLMNPALMITGGTLVFVATLLLINQLRQMHPAGAAAAPRAAEEPGGRWFYVAGLSYFLVGIIVGTGLWLGWSDILHIKTPVEVHIHANNWGLMSLVFAGLIIDTYPRFAGRSLAWPRSLRPIFWLMTLGALGLVLGPWLKSNYFAVPGLIMHLTATIWLLLNVIRPLLGDEAMWRKPGIWHLTTAYLWILAPVMVAPLIILGVPGFPGAGIEQNAPQALIYGWVLQFGFALLPYFFSRAFRPQAPAGLGGSWLSLAAVHLGGVALWASIFSEPYQGLLHGLAYALWAVAILPIAWQMWQLARAGLAQLADSPAAMPAD